MRVGVTDNPHSQHNGASGKSREDQSELSEVSAHTLVSGCSYKTGLSNGAVTFQNKTTSPQCPPKGIPGKRV